MIVVNSVALQPLTTNQKGFPDEDVFDSLNHMNNSEAPGPDGSLQVLVHPVKLTDEINRNSKLPVNMIYTYIIPPFKT